MWHESLRASNRTIWIVTKLLTIIGLPLKVLTSSLRYLYAWNMGWIIIMKKLYNSYILCASAGLITFYYSTMQSKQNTLKIRPVAWSPVTYVLYIKQTCKIIFKMFPFTFLLNTLKKHKFISVNMFVFFSNEILFQLTMPNQIYTL